MPPDDFDLTLAALAGEPLLPADVERIRQIEADAEAARLERVADLDQLKAVGGVHDKEDASTPPKPITERKRLWLERVAHTEQLEQKATVAAARAATDPDSLVARLAAKQALDLARQARATIERGEATYKRQGDEAHGKTPEIRRAGWRDAKREQREKLNGKAGAQYQLRADMTPAEWADHVKRQKVEQNRRAYARKKAKSP